MHIYYLVTSHGHIQIVFNIIIIVTFQNVFGLKHMICFYFFLNDLKLP